MNAAELLAELTRLDIRLVAHGDRLRYCPRSAVTPHLAALLKAHKAEVLEILLAVERTRQSVMALTVDETWEPVDGQQLDRDASPDWEMRPDAAGRMGWEPADLHEEDRTWAGDYREIDPPEPCTHCNSLAAWWDVLGGQHCMICDPPTESFRLFELVRKLQAKAKLRRG